MKCYGRGILGYRPWTNAVVLCTCVWRNLRRRGVNVSNRIEVMKALAVEPPVAEKAGEGGIRGEGENRCAIDGVIGAGDGILMSPYKRRKPRRKE